MNWRLVLPLCVTAFVAVPISKSSGSALAIELTSQVHATSLRTRVASRPSKMVPSDADIFHPRAFAEPLVPIGGTTSVEENVALRVAIDGYEERTNQDDHSPILAFLDRFPNSAWRPALLTNLGLEYRRTGWFL